MNAFNWRDTPSEIGATMPDSFRKPNFEFHLGTSCISGIG